MPISLASSFPSRSGTCEHVAWSRGVAKAAVPPAQLAESPVVDAEVMGDLVDDGSADLVTDFLPGAAGVRSTISSFRSRHHVVLPSQSFPVRAYPNGAAVSRGNRCGLVLLVWGVCYGAELIECGHLGRVWIPDELNS